MDLQRLRGFYWTAQLGSVSGAARMIHLSQSAISHQLRSLEKELGTKLYERTRRGIALTPDGVRLMEYARRIVHAVDDLKNEFADRPGPPRGTVRIAAFRGIATHALPAMTRRFHAAYPDVRLVIASRAFDTRLLDMVARGEVDLGAVASWNEFRSLRYLEFASHEMVACTAPDHPWVGRTEAPTLEELAAEPLVLYEKGTAIRNRLDQVFENGDLRPEVAVAVGGSQALLEFVKIGLGVGLVSSLVAAPGRDPGLHVIPVSELFGRLGYGFVLPRGRYVPLTVQAFLASAGVAAERRQES